MKRDTILVSTFGAYLNEENLVDEFGDRTEVLEYALEQGKEELMGVGSLDDRTVMFGRDLKIARDLKEVEGVGEFITESIAGQKLLDHDAYDVSEENDDWSKAIGQAKSLAEKALMTDPDDYIDTDLNQAVAIAKNTPQPDAVLIVTDGSTPDGVSWTVRNAVSAGIPVSVIDIRETVDWDNYDFGDEEDAAEDEAEAEAEAEPSARPDAEARAVASGD